MGGVVPPHQRFDPGDLAGPDVGDGLIHHAEFPACLEGVFQLAPDLHPSRHGAVVLARVELDLAPALLRQVHGDVGTLQQRGLVVAVLGSERDAGARGDGEHEPVHPERAGHLAVEVVHDADRLLRPSHVGNDQRELVAAEAGDRGAARHRSHQALGHHLQQVITDGVTERVVDLLEAIDVEEDDGHSLALLERGLGPVAKEVAVGKLGQRVVRGLIPVVVASVLQGLEEIGALQARHGVGGECVEKLEVFVVEAVFLLVPVEGHDRPDRDVPVHERSDHGLAVVADDRVARKVAIAS